MIDYAVSLSQALQAQKSDLPGPLMAKKDHQGLSIPFDLLTRLCGDHRLYLTVIETPQLYRVDRRVVVIVDVDISTATMH